MTPAVRAALPLPTRAELNEALLDNSAGRGGWDARLTLAFERREQRTALVRNEHLGPLVVQKALYPEDPALCHAVIIHPPGGIAGGDRLLIDVDTGDRAEVLLTTPGATRWYRSDGRRASQTVHLRAGRNALVEWLPLETIVFDGADAQSTVKVDCADDACVAGWEIIAFGRRASREQFRNGRFRQTIEIRRGDKLLWAEYGEVHGGDPLLDSPIGYAGRAVSGLLWLAGPDGDAQPERNDNYNYGARETVQANDLQAGVTRLPGGIMLARCLGDSTEQVKDHLLRIWKAWRPGYARRPATLPRLWST